MAKNSSGTSDPKAERYDVPPAGLCVIIRDKSFDLLFRRGVQYPALMLPITPAYLQGIKTVALPGALNGLCPVLLALFTTPHIGVTLLDRRLRFQAINESLANINGIPLSFHLGKPLHRVLGNAAPTFQPVIEHVLATGQPLYNLHITAQLPTRKEVGHWIETFIPIPDRAGRVGHVAAIVQEVTHTRRLATSVRRLSTGLRHVLSTVKRQKASSPQFLERLLERSVSQTQAIADLVISPSNWTVRPLSNYPQPGPPPLPQEHAHLLPAPAGPPDGRLSARELQVLELLAGGQSNKQIAAALALSIRTVETYRARLMLKLGLHSIPELVRYAMRNNLA